MAENYICLTCGVQYPASNAAPEHCPICEDERQYIGANGQQWTTLEAIRKDRKNTFTALGPNLTSIVSEAQFAIGQRAHLIQTPNGNVLWDCISMIDDDTVAKINGMGGLKAIAVSHPHFHSTTVEWSKAFGGIPVYIHTDNRQWVMRPDPVVQLWDGNTREIMDGITLVRCGGHFEGSSILHWREGAEGHGTIFTGDTIMIVPDKRYVSFMYSYPNLIPLNSQAINRITRTVEPFAFDQIYDAFGRVIQQDGKNAVMRSARRYIAAIGG
jgi:glyoxylase-like metal-dependent hydrolase (beta-lactamase superfamily II)